MRDGDAILVMVQDGRVSHYSWNMGLPHAEFERRKTGALPDGEVMGINSKYFYNDQMPAPPEVNAAIRDLFE